MRKKSATVQMDKNDKFRALLSDTTPAELPIIISNDGFFRNIRRASNYTGFAKEIITELILPPIEGKKVGIPHRYRIFKNEASQRRMALPHPRSQLEVCSFYDLYSDLITEFCAKSSFSVRYPVRVAGRYYIPNPNQNIHEEKSGTITTTSIEKLSKHPASYFAYNGFDRLHKLFSSRLYNGFERQYPSLCILDISNCFGSIYTHTVTWATKSLKEAKANTSANMYGAAFDRLMQILNYNETNGIVVGPEVCRIFAETILGTVDANLEKTLQKDYSLKAKSDYSIVRYVDNYYVFYKKTEDLAVIVDELSEHLHHYKLEFNTSKTELLKRPFFTRKSMSILEADRLISTHIDPLSLREDFNGDKLTVPQRVRSNTRLLTTLVTELRRVCHVSNVDYGEVVPYILSALRRRCQSLLEDSESVIKHAKMADGITEKEKEIKIDHLLQNYCSLIGFYIESSFHLFSLSPTFSASLDISNIIIRSANFLRTECIEDFYIVRERMQKWSTDLFHSSSFAYLLEGQRTSSVEVLNVLCALKTLEFDGEYFSTAVANFHRSKETTGYFEIVTKLFLYRNDSSCSELKSKLVKQASEHMKIEPDLGLSSESVHLLFDLLSCPYLENTSKRSILRSSIASHNSEPKSNKIKVPTNVEIDELCDQFVASPWFVEWDEINLLRLIEKKELRRSYS